MTVPERKLWAILRNHRLAALKFRRQQPIGFYIVDFICFEKKLVVEVDGMSHVGRAEQDEARQRYLELEGYRVIRVTNDEVLKQRVAVAQAIARAAGLDW
jgi:very-short-patch-repair endonuclease